MPTELWVIPVAIVAYLLIGTMVSVVALIVTSEEVRNGTPPDDRFVGALFTLIWPALVLLGAVSVLLFALGSLPSRLAKWLR